MLGRLMPREGRFFESSIAKPGAKSRVRGGETPCSDA